MQTTNLLGAPPVTAGDARGAAPKPATDTRKRKVKEAPSGGAPPAEAAAAAAAGATPELAGDCFMVARPRGSFTAPQAWSRQRRRAASMPARWRRRRPGLDVLGRNLLPPTCSGGGARCASWRRLPDNAGSSTRRPRAVPEREREREGEGEGRPEAELPGLVGALPRELKRNAPSRFCLVFLRCEREREEGSSAHQ